MGHKSKRVSSRVTKNRELLTALDPTGSIEFTRLVLNRLLNRVLDQEITILLSIPMVVDLAKSTSGWLSTWLLEEAITLIRYSNLTKMESFYSVF